MIYSRPTFSAFLVALAILPAACAPQPAGMAAPAPASSLSGPSNVAPAASPMRGMDQSNMPGMQGMDMNAMMTRCAQVRQQPALGQTTQGRQMLDQCDQMDRSMGMTPPPRR